MRTLLRISLIGNLVLLSAITWILRNNSGKGVKERTQAAGEMANNSPRPAATAPENTGLEAFRWRELESADYRTYIENLRTIECPERTIRDIVTADVHALYEQRHRALDRRHQPEMELTLARRSSIRAALDEGHARLRQEETSLLLALLGPETTPEEQEPRPLATQPSPDSPITMPLVFQDLDLGSLNLNPAQLGAIANLRTQFVASVGGLNQDPNDPGYKARWQESQPEFDDLLQGMLGAEAYQNYQTAARISADTNRNK